MNKAILGHKTQRESLKKLIEFERFPSCIMLAGDSGIGKKRVAMEACSTLFCETSEFGGCGKCKECRLFSSGNVPDFHLIECGDSDAANAAGIRDLLYSLNLKPFSGKVRLVLFNDADLLSLQAANILLKSLEEPRPGTHFILIASNPRKLPETIISRCQVWYFDQLTNSEIETIVRNTGLASDAVSIEDLVLLADGSLEYIESIASHYNNWEKIKNQLDEISDGNSFLSMQLARELAVDKDNLQQNIKYLRIYARNMMLEATLYEMRLRWSCFLTNVISSERLIFERNLGASYVLEIVLLGLSRKLRSNNCESMLLEKMVV